MDGNEVYVEIKYKTVAKKVKPMVLPILSHHEENVEKASMQPNIRDPRKVGYEFTDTTLDG